MDRWLKSRQNHDETGEMPRRIDIVIYEWQSFTLEGNINRKAKDKTDQCHEVKGDGDAGGETIDFGGSQVAKAPRPMRSATTLELKVYTMELKRF